MYCMIIYDIHIFDVETLCEHLHVIVVMVFHILLICSHADLFLFMIRKRQQTLTT